MKDRIGRIVIGRTGDGAEVTAAALDAAGAIAVMLNDAVQPSIAQTLDRCGDQPIRPDDAGELAAIAE